MRVKALLDRPIERDWPYRGIDATYIIARQNGRTVSPAVIVAVSANPDGKREVLGTAMGALAARRSYTTLGGTVFVAGGRLRPDAFETSDDEWRQTHLRKGLLG